MYSYAPGETVTLEIMRGKDPIELAITYGEYTEPCTPFDGSKGQKRFDEKPFLTV